MTALEIKVDRLDDRVSSLEQRVAETTANVNNLIAEMRDRDNQRAAEIMELRQRQDAAQARHDEDMREIRASIDGMGKHVRNLTVAAMVGIGASVMGIGAIAVTVIYSVMIR